MTPHPREPDTYADATEYVLARGRWSALVAFRAEHGRWPRFLVALVSRHTGTAWWACEDAALRRPERRRLQRLGFVHEEVIPRAMPEPAEPRWVGPGEAPAPTGGARV